MIFSLVFSLVFLGCFENKEKEGQKRYEFITQQNEYFEIKSNFSFLNLFYKKKLVKKNILVFFLDIDNLACFEYFQVLENLQKSYSDLEVLAISTRRLTKQEFIDFYTRHKVSFLLLNPLDSKSILKDFSNKLAREKISLPFLVLYDRAQKMYQYYEGAVPQEMFMFDLKILN